MYNIKFNNGNKTLILGFDTLQIQGLADLCIQIYEISMSENWSQKPMMICELNMTDKKQ
jgi:hypothetical protein